MRFPDSFLEEIRARLPISQVVGRHVQWDRKRSQPNRGDYWACCPFHHEKTPSFHVDDRKGFYYCFGCHAKGDHFRFLVEKEGLSFAEAVAQLAGEAGLEVPKPDPAQRQQEEKRHSLLEVLEEAARFYEQQLRAPAGAQALRYAREQRGLPEEVIEHFRIGCAPDARDALLRHLKGKGVDVALMLEAGLVAQPEDGRAAYDRFRHRLMFPIRDVKGRVIAFGGRALGEARAKYLNSPETPVFHKSHVLYNLDQARQGAFERGEIIVVEGYMDVIALHQAGFPHAVAPLGTALTESQLALLWRTVPQPVLCFDGDAAGLKAAWRALEVALPHLKPGHSLRFAFLPEGMDPDDLLRLRGPEALQPVLEVAEPMVDFLFRQVRGEHAIGTPEERAALQARLEALANGIEDATVRQHYRDELRDRMRALFGGRVSGAVRKRRWNAPSGRNKTVGVRDFVAPPSARLKRSAAAAGDVLGTPPEQDLLRMLLVRPDIVPEVAEEIASFSFSTQALDSLVQAILDICTNFAAGDSQSPGGRTADGVADERQIAAAVDSETLHAHLQGRPEARLARQLMRSAASCLVGSFARQPWEKAVWIFLQRLEEVRQLRQLRAELALAEQAFADAPSEENLARLTQLQAELEATMQARMDEE